MKKNSTRALTEQLKNIVCLLLLLLFAPGNTNVKAQGTWIPLANIPRYHSGGEMILLTDGTVICKSDTCFCDVVGTPAWNRLTPDIHGSYVNGTWDTIPDMHYSRVYVASQVLQDGRVFVAGGEEGNGQGTDEIYSPLKNTWTLLPPPGQTISDANSEILPNGNVLFALVDGATGARNTAIFFPANDSVGQGPRCLRTHNESAWIKLRDSSILFMDGYGPTSERYIPSLNEWIADATSPVNLYDPLGFECGPAFILPDGRGFFLGSTPYTAIYTPSGNTSPGTWVKGPDMPNETGMPDAPAAMMVNGKILCDVSPSPIEADTVYPHPVSFYEFDYVADSFKRVSSPNGSDTLKGQSYKGNMLDLPDGTVLFSNQGSLQYYVYVPDGSPLAAGKPTIANIIPMGCDTFMMTGTLFNGISEGAAYGDDWQMATNYPMVSLTRGTNVYYARTYHWNRTGVQTGSLPDTTWFSLPYNLPGGTYSLVVSANGISSDSASLVYQSCSTGIAQLPNLNKNISVYPNPSDGPATVSFTVNTGGNYIIAINDMLGRTIQQETGTAQAGTNSHLLNVNEVASGLYIITLTEGDNIFKTKLVVK